MKKVIFGTAFMLLTASGIAFSQSTTISTNPKQKAEADTASSAGATQGERKTTDGANTPNKETSKTATQAGNANGTGSRVNPGGDSPDEAASKSAATTPAQNSKAAPASGEKSKNKKAKP